MAKIILLFTDIETPCTHIPWNMKTKYENHVKHIKSDFFLENTIALQKKQQIFSVHFSIVKTSHTNTQHVSSVLPMNPSKPMSTHPHNFLYTIGRMRV